jgi:hypothetical protein
VLSATRLTVDQTISVSGLVSNATEQGKMNELIIAAVLIGLVLIAVLVSWISGKRSGAESKELEDVLDHQEKLLKAAMEQRKLDIELKKAEAEIKGKPYEPLTQDAVDKMLEKYKNLN